MQLIAAAAPVESACGLRRYPHTVTPHIYFETSINTACHGEMFKMKLILQHDLESLRASLYIPNAIKWSL